MSREPIKIFHEVPRQFFMDSIPLTDGDYALVHLLESNPMYLQDFLDAKAMGREIILDNSVYELGEGVAPEVLHKWADILRPAWVILPDVIDNGRETVVALQKYLQSGRKFPEGVRTMCVVHGRSFDEVKKCYQWVEPFVDMVGFAFRTHWRGLGNMVTNAGPVQWSQGRKTMIDMLLDNGIINTDKPHHLLGCSLTTEYEHYFSSRYSFIYSLDTSQPVMYGLSFGKYPEGGAVACPTKPPGKLHTHINRDLSLVEREAIEHNILAFRQYIREGRSAYVKPTNSANVPPKV